MQHRDDLNGVVLDTVGHDIWRVGNDEFARVRHPAGPTDRRKRRQALHRRSYSLDHAHCRCRIIRGDPLADVLKSPEIARGVFEAASRHRRCNSRLYRSSACSWDSTSPASSSAIPAAISPICHSLSSTYAAIASAARYDFDRLVLRAKASSFAFSAASILAVTTVVSAPFTQITPLTAAIQMYTVAASHSSTTA
jgi:hypothetical protein